MARKMQRSHPDFFASWSSFVWESHSYFQAGKTGTQKESVSQLEWEQKDQGSHLGRGHFVHLWAYSGPRPELSLLQSTYLTIHYSLNVSNDRELITHPKVAYSILIRNFMHLYKQYWLSTYCYISWIAFGTGDTVVNETELVSHFLLWEIDNKQRNEYITCLVEIDSEKQDKGLENDRGVLYEWPRRVLWDET